MGTDQKLPVDPANALTARWIRAFGAHPTVASGVGVWPLLAIVADAAGGEARAELAAATGIDPEGGTEAGLAMIEALAATDGVRAALGLWSRPDLPIRPEWSARLPPEIQDRFSGDLERDRARLDEWASSRTDGLIKKMPIRISPATLLLLASALTIRTTWRQPFRTGSAARAGWPLMTRTTDDPGIVRATADVTCVRIEGDNGIDVELVIGAASAAPAHVLSAGFAVVVDGAQAVAGAELPDGRPGHGIAVEQVVSTSDSLQCVVEAPKFTVRASHDLTAFPDVFGLATVTDASQQRLPGISDQPLAVDRAAQDAMAEFTETGFRAAAVTAISMIAASMVRQIREYEVRRVTVTFDRPYGFLAVHRDSGLVLVAGWVTVPDAT
jgi:serine protease inhibitor